MTVTPNISVSDGNLVVQGKTILKGVPENIVLTPGPGVGLVAGAFIGATADHSKSLHVFPVGVLEDLRFMCCFRFKLWWMTQRMGTCGKDIPLETQILLVESKDTAEGEHDDAPTIYTVFLPLLEGQFRAVLQGNEKNELEICLESGDSAVETNQGNYLVYMHAGTNPFEVINQAVKAVEKIITNEGRRVGIKKALVFYVGKAPKGTKTNWIMHEYRLSEPPKKNGSAKLDDWVLCRIYKKNSSAQKPILGVSSKELSHGSSSSSSSQFDDMLESLPEINDRFFTLPRMNSLKTIQQDEKFNIQNLTSGNFDWASLAGAVTSLPELVPGGQSQAQTQAQGHLGNNMYNDMYVPSIPPLSRVDSPCERFGASVEEEVQSGHRTQHRFENSGFFQQNSNEFAQSFSNSPDPFGIRYPTQQGGFRLRQ